MPRDLSKVGPACYQRALENQEKVKSDQLASRLSVIAIALQKANREGKVIKWGNDHRQTIPKHLWDAILRAAGVDAVG